LAKQHARQSFRMVASSSDHSCRLGSSTIYSSDHLDCCSHLDGLGVHSECKAVRAHPLSLYRPVLPRDGRASIIACFRYRLCRSLWVVRFGRSYSRWKQNDLVDHRASMGNIFIAADMSAIGGKADIQSATRMSAKLAKSWIARILDTVVPTASSCVRINQCSLMPKNDLAIHHHLSGLRQRQNRNDAD
jgi:hypothetical protein